MNKPKLIFFGNERLATSVTTKAPVLRALVEAGYEIPAVIANYTPGTSREDRRLEIVEVAHAYHIPVLLPDNLKEIMPKLKKFNAEAAILVAYGKIIPQEVIDIFPKGIINTHPSLLPKYRGPTPIETTILDNVAETGVSLMRLTAKMDAGPVYTQERAELTGSESKQELADKLLSSGQRLLKENIQAILEGWLMPKPQLDAEATYTKLIKKDNGILDFSRPAEILERAVRAYAGWPKSRAKIHGQDVIVTKSRVVKNKDEGLLVMACQPGYLEVLELTGPSGKTMSGADFLRGYKK